MESHRCIWVTIQNVELVQLDEIFVAARRKGVQAEEDIAARELAGGMLPRVVLDPPRQQASHARSALMDTIT